MRMASIIHVKTVLRGEVSAIVSGRLLSARVPLDHTQDYAFLHRLNKQLQPFGLVALRVVSGPDNTIAVARCR